MERVFYFHVKSQLRGVCYPCLRDLFNIVALVGGSPPRNGRDTHTDRQTDRFECDYVAARKESLHVHIYSVHGGIRPYPKD